MPVSKKTIKELKFIAGQIIYDLESAIEGVEAGVTNLDELGLDHLDVDVGRFYKQLEKITCL